MSGTEDEERRVEGTGSGDPADGTDLPRPASGDRPADVARRALRAARERDKDRDGERASGERVGRGSGAAEGPVGAGSDAGIGSASGTGGASGLASSEGAAGPSEAGEGASAAGLSAPSASSSSAASSPSVAGDGAARAARPGSAAGPRPGDVAREALRRATEAARSAGAGGARTGAAGSVGAGDDDHADTGGRVSSGDRGAIGVGSLGAVETGRTGGTVRGARTDTGSPAPSRRDSRDMPGSVSGDEHTAAPVTGGGGHEVHEEVEAEIEADGSGRDGDGRAAGGAEARDTDAAESVPSGVPDAGTTGGARPGDVAREALRAARDEAKRARAGGGDEGGSATGALRRGVGPGARPRPDRGPTGGTRGRRSGASAAHPEGASRAQELRELLAGAFQLPSDVSDPGLPPHPAGAAGDEGVGGHPHAHPEGEGEATTVDAPLPGAAGSSDPLASGPPVRTRPGPRTETGDPVDSDVEQPGYRASESQASDPAVSATRSPDPLGPDPSPEPSGPRRSASEQAGEVSERWPEPRPPHADPHAHPHADRHPPSGRRAPANPALSERLPRSMASPGRDRELRRTFPRFPARDAVDGAFAETWWGNAWVAALEEGALDAARLARGRTYAGQGHVDAITVTPGLVLAYVHGSRPRPYRVQIRVRTLADADWDRFLDAAAERPGHIAALLDKEMPKSLADCGAELLPGPGELEPQCSCPDFGHPCKHAAALCYQTARLLDEDPFVLLLLRGRGERELLDALSRRNATRAARASQEREPAPLPGVRARDVLARRVLPPLPVPLPPPVHPEQPPAYPGAPGGPDPFALDQLATDAAARAHALLTAGRDPVADLTLWQDAVRIAAARPGSGLTATTRALYASLASATGRAPADLARAVAAWRQGGFDALTVLEEPWDPPAGRFDRARPLLLAADLPAFRPWRNHLTHPGGHAQLRLGRNGLWYAFESEPGHDDWWPRGTPDLDPVGALTGLGAPGDL